MSPVRKPPAPVAVAAPVQGLAFGALEFYSAGFLLPEGRYCLYFNVLNHAFTKQDGTQGKSRLGVMVDAYPLERPDDVRQQFLSMGSKADQSFQPTADGKSVAAIPGGAAAGLPGLTGWNIFLRSLYDCGMPKDTFTDSLVAIDGIHVVTQNVPEPEERKNLASNTGEVVEERRGPSLVPVVSEILESGQPWLGTGGVPTVPLVAPAATPLAPRAPGAPKAPAKVAGRIAPAAPIAAPVVGEEVDSEDLQASAINAITEVLTVPANANGCTRLLLRTSVFKNLNAKDPSGATGQAVLNTFFATDEALNSLLNVLGYKALGPNVSLA